MAVKRLSVMIALTLTLLMAAVSSIASGAELLPSFWIHRDTNRTFFHRATNSPSLQQCVAIDADSAFESNHNPLSELLC
jgi:hypothetical protein